METLSDDILLNILEQASKERGHHVLRETFPLVCKRWRNAIYGAKGKWQARCDQPLKREGRCILSLSMHCRSIFVPMCHSGL